MSVKDYQDYDSNYTDSNNYQEQPPFDKKLIGVGAVIIFVLFLVIIAAVVLPQVRPDLFENKPRLSLTHDDSQISFKGSLTINGELVDVFVNDKNKLTLTVNQKETKKITLKVTGISGGEKTASAKIVLSDGRKIVLSPDAVIISADGTVTISINPEDDLGLDEDTIAGLIDGSISFTLELIVENTTPSGDKEVVAVEIPVQLLFSEFIGSGCLLLSRQSVSETTHFGVLEVNAKVRIACDTEDNLYSLVEWKEERMGNVEVLFNEFNDGSTLAEYPLKVKNNPAVGVYDVKIIFTPLKKFAGKKASFNLVFGSGRSEARINFDVVSDNLEQCIKVISNDNEIINEYDTASITIDASKCSSEKIEIYLCDTDPTCSFAPEGGIDLSTNYFSLSGSSKVRTIQISRGEIPGVYGVTVKARVAGLEKTFIDEKEIFVKPTSELVFPERYVVSLLGKGMRDYVPIRNIALSEDVEIDASVCSVYRDSLGIGSEVSITGSAASPISGFGRENAWWRKLYTNPETYAGDGKYQAALVGSAPALDNIRATTQSISAQKNAQIKQAYIDIMDMKKGIEDSFSSVQGAYDAAMEMDAAAKTYNDYKNVQLATQYASVMVGTVTLANSAAIFAEISAASGLATTFATTAKSEACAPAIPLAEAGAATATKAQVLAAGELAFSTFSTVSTIQSIVLDDLPDIDTGPSLERTQEALDLITDTKKDFSNLEEYANLILESASVDSFTSISKDYAEAERYLLLAKEENKKILAKLKATREMQVAADEEITFLAQEAASSTDMLISFSALAYQAIGLIFKVITGQTFVQTLLTTATGETGDGSLAALPECMIFPYIWCCPSFSTGEAAFDALTAASSSTGALNETTITVSESLNLAFAGFDSAMQLMSDFSEELGAAKVTYQGAMDKLDSAIRYSEEAIESIDAAIEAANYLSRETKNLSSGASYTQDFALAGEDFDKKRFTGVISSAIANGIVNGAYEGGVYTKDVSSSRNYYSEDSSSKKISLQSDGWKEDCSNRIKLKLPDYVINLVNDAKEVSTTNSDIISFWSYYEPKVFDFYKEQQISLVFTNGGLKKNIYDIVTINVNKHNHANPTTITSEFGPFNIQDSEIEPLVYKYHFKFNTAARKSASTQSNAVCEKDLLLGNTGEEALPKIILNWDWNAVNEESIKENYLDSTQLSILVSKRLSAFNEFLSRTSISCPVNPADAIIQRTKPSDTTMPRVDYCYLPMSTKEFEGKPALYYFLNSVAAPQEGYDEFFDGPLASNAQEGLALIDFNVNLMRDGLGLNFQNDFVYDYTKTILRSNPSFTDPDNGLAKYFRNDTKFFYTNETIAFKPQEIFILPDAGLYRVRALIEFDNKEMASIFSVGSLTAKIKIIPTLIQPINKNYSPFYYTPFDGSVGLRAENNRVGYGTSLSGGDTFYVSKKDGAYMDKSQKDSLAKTKTVTLTNPFWLNSLPSRRAKLFEYSYFFNGSTDSNSRLVFSPTIATPLLITLSGTTGSNPFMTYGLKKQNRELDPISNNLLLLTGINGCNDFFGYDSTILLNQTPDIQMGDYYGMSFKNVVNPGKVTAKTTAFMPTIEDYDMVFSPTGFISTTNEPTPSKQNVSLTGIAGMEYNDVSTSKIETLVDLFNAVKKKSVCVSKLGDKEIYWWPEDYLFEKENSKGDSLIKREVDVKASCIKN